MKRFRWIWCRHEGAKADLIKFGNGRRSWLYCCFKCEQIWLRPFDSTGDPR